MRKLARATFQSAAAMAATIGLGIVGNKIVAIVLGPLGLGMFSLVRQTYQTAVLAGSLQGETALVQGVASRSGRERAAYIRTAVLIVTVAALVVAAALLLFGPEIARYTTNDTRPETELAFRTLSVVVVAGVVMVTLLSLLAGVKAIGSRAVAQTICWAAIAVLAYPAAKAARNGSVVPLVILLGTGAVAGSAFALLRVAKLGVLGSLRDADQLFDRSAAGHFAKLAGVTMMATFIGSLTVLAIRALVSRTHGLAGAGFFDAAWMLSLGYAALLHPAIMSYYLPTLSGAASLEERQDLMRSMVRLTTLASAPCITALVVLKPAVVHILYSPQFGPAIELVRWFLIADYMKITSWVIATPMLAHARTRAFFWSELASNAIMLVLIGFGLYGTGRLEMIGPPLVVSYMLYLGAVTWYAHSKGDLYLDIRTVLLWCAGLGAVSGASVQTWTRATVDWGSLAWVAAAAAGTALLLDRRDQREIQEALSRSVSVN